MIKTKLLTVLLGILLIQATLAFSQSSLSNSRGLHSSPVNNFSASFINLKRAKIPIQVGVFSMSPGKAQLINIQGLEGDYFSVNRHSQQKALVGVGYFVDGYETSRFRLMYGVNAFYMAKTRVNGTITQELLFTNLSYRYSLTNYPIYAATKIEVKSSSDKYNLTLDLGVGPNIIHTSGFREASIDNGITIPDRAFSGQTRAVVSATAGVGIKLNDILRKMPLECGYRFFYLGQGRFNKLTDQLLNPLKTGHNYANAFICSTIV